MYRTYESVLNLAAARPCSFRLHHLLHKPALREIFCMYCLMLLRIVPLQRMHRVNSDLDTVTAQIYSC
jgi:hypothetical protein